MNPGDYYDLHALWESRHPDDLRYAQIIAKRRAEHGLAPDREFPCKGVLRVEDRIGSTVIVTCSECGFEIGAPVLERAEMTNTEDMAA